MNARALALPVAAIAASAALIATQLAAGGAGYEPRSPRDPCAAPARFPAPRALEPLAERIVLAGITETACRTGVTRERLLLALASRRDRRALARRLGTGEAGLARVLELGFDRAITRLERRGELPRVSALLPSLAGQLGLPGLLEQAILRIPAVIVDGLLPTAEVLRQSLERVDVEEVLAGLGDPAALEPELRDAIRDGAIATAREQLAEQLPGGLGDLF